MNSNLLFAVATLVGAIVGLGMFGIPYAASKAGFFVVLAYLVVLGIVVLFVHLIYGEVVERTRGKHRLTGYAEKYLGRKWKNIVGLGIVSTIYTALLAYIIVAGEFLSLLFPNFATPLIFGTIFWFVLSLAIWRGVRTVGWVELLMSGFLILFVFIFFARGIGEIRSVNFSSFSFANLFLPYGVVLFAYAGSLAIPEIRELIKIDGPQYKKAIILGSLIPIALYVVFAILVVGVSGAETSQEALRGLGHRLGPGIAKIGALFGLLALATSYLVLGLNIKHTFEYDWKLKGGAAMLLTALVPVVLYIAGFQEFIGVISVSGAVFGAVIGVVILLVYMKATVFGDKEPGYVLGVPRVIVWGLISMLALGGVYEIIYLLI